jgi:2-methylcitrate dehydratase PrpD
VARIDFERIDAELGERWEFLDFGRTQTMFSASRTSSITDCAFLLRDAYRIDPADIDEVVVDTTTRFKLLDDRSPPNAQAGKFSIPYCVAQVLIGRRREEMLDEAFTEEAFLQDGWRAVADRVRVEVEPEFDAAFETHPRVSSPSRITVRTRDGSSHTQRIDGYFGLSGSPEINPADFDLKFLHLAERRLPPGDAQRAVDLAHEIETGARIGELMRLCGSRRAGHEPTPVASAAG